LIDEPFHKSTVFNQRPSHVYIKIPVEVKFILLLAVVQGIGPCDSISQRRKWQPKSQSSFVLGFRWSLWIIGRWL